MNEVSFKELFKELKILLVIGAGCLIFTCIILGVIFMISLAKPIINNYLSKNIEAGIVLPERQEEKSDIV